MIPDVVICVSFEEEGGRVSLQPVAGVRRTGFRFEPRAAASGAFIKRIDAEGVVLFTGGDSNHSVVFPLPDGTYLLYDEAGPPPLVDYPSPPLPALDDFGNVHWTRFIGDISAEYNDRYYAILPGGNTAFVYEWTGPPTGLSISEGIDFYAAVLLSIRYKDECLREYLKQRTLQLTNKECNPRIRQVLSGLDPRFPGSGRLVGEEFRIVEPDNDYLRLVGRGGDEYIAWDFVLGTLDSGEWIIMADDGLYTAVREGSRVVVKEPYRGSVLDVRGPRTAYKYPVVPTRTFKHAELYGANVTYDATLLKWPLSGLLKEVALRFNFKGVVHTSGSSVITCDLGYADSL
ncbi:hypothetical protein [Pyrobaculum sp.]|uniref:hypothetical protein n=1 Tax=Pyrobaculum sp. TaxID=2004705 RepID=UPI00316B2C90